MVDCITICNSACITCIWCILFSVCFPRFSKNLRKVDSSECCVRRKSILKHRKARSRDFPTCVKDNSIHAQRFKDFSCFESDRKDRRKYRSFSGEKICDRPLKERQNACRCLKKKRKTSPVCNRSVKYSNNCNKSDGFLSREDNNAIWKQTKANVSIKDLEVY